MEACVCQPIDTIKTRLQLDHSKKYSGDFPKFLLWQSQALSFKPHCLGSRACPCSAFLSLDKGFNPCQFSRCGFASRVISEYVIERK